MRGTWDKILESLQRGDIRISEHGYDELAADGITVREIMVGVFDAVILEDYPDYPKGSCVLTLQKGLEGRPLHVVWGIPRSSTELAVLVTAYRPDPERWEDGFRRRKK